MKTGENLINVLPNRKTKNKSLVDVLCNCLNVSISSFFLFPLYNCVFEGYKFPGGGVLPYKRLMGMCRWMGSHFHDWIDYNGVTFLVELLEWGRTFSGFLR